VSYQKLGLILTASSLLLTGCLSVAPDLTPAEEETREKLSQSNYQPAPRELRDNIETQEVLAQAAFWSHEYNLNPSDLESAIKFSAVLRKLGNPGRAVEITRTTRALYPENPYLNAEHAAALLADQQTRPAMKILDAALKDAPAYGRLWSLKGVALDQMEKYAEARPFYNRALQITPNDPNVMANMGLNFALSGDPHTAKTWLSRAAAHPDASDSVFANLDLVESLVAEAAPLPARAPASLNQNPPPSYQPYKGQAGAREQAGVQPNNPAAPRQYGAYEAPPTPASPRPYAQTQVNTHAQGAYPAPQVSSPFAAPPAQAKASAAAAAAAAAQTSETVPTSQDVLARIANNVRPKTTVRQAPRGYGRPNSNPNAAPHPGQYQGQYQGQPQGRQHQGQAQRPGYQQYAQQQPRPQNYAPQNYHPQAGHANTPPVRPQQGQAYGGAQHNGPNGAQPNQYQGQYAGQGYQGQYQGQGRPAPQYNQQAPQIRGSYPAPQSPYYQAPQAQPQSRAPARRRG